MSWVYLDDHFPDHPKVARAGGDAAWLFVCGLAYCKRQETKGLIPVAQVPRLSDRKQPDRLAAKLVAVGLWEEDDEFFKIHDYDEWNRPEESRRAAGRKAARARWDKERNANASESHSERIPSALADQCPTPHTPSPSNKSSSSNTLVGAHAVEEEEEDSRLGECWELLAKRDAEAYTAKGGVIRSRGFFATAADNRRALHEKAASELLSDHPDWSAERLADALDSPQATNSEQSAMLARMERNAAHLRGESCETCNGDDWIEVGSGVMAPCPTCRPEDFAALGAAS